MIFRLSPGRNRIADRSRRSPLPFALLPGLFVWPFLTWAAPANSGFPFADEDLSYTINWPSGLSLGEGRITARHSGEEWNLQLTLDASIPGFAVKDEYRSRATGDLCSSLFSKRLTHGARKTQEDTVVDRTRGVAARVTLNGGGKSEMPISDCTRDALSYLFWSRRELGQGRVPKAQQVLFGALYQASFQYAGGAVIRVNDKEAQTDKLVCTMKGPASDVHFEMYVARDAARTPLLLRIPLAMGTFTMELVR